MTENRSYRMEPRPQDRIPSYKIPDRHSSYQSNPSQEKSSPAFSKNIENDRDLDLQLRPSQISHLYYNLSEFDRPISLDSKGESKGRISEKLPNFSEGMMSQESPDRQRAVASSDVFRDSNTRFRGDPNNLPRAGSLRRDGSNSPEYGKNYSNNYSKLAEDERENLDYLKYSRGSYLDYGSPIPTPEQGQRLPLYDEMQRFSPTNTSNYNRRPRTAHSRAIETLLEDLGHEALMEFNENIKILNNILHSPKSNSPKMRSRSTDSEHERTGLEKYYDSHFPEQHPLESTSSNLSHRLQELLGSIRNNKNFERFSPSNSFSGISPFESPERRRIPKLSTEGLGGSNKQSPSPTRKGHDKKPKEEPESHSPSRPAARNLQTPPTRVKQKSFVQLSLYKYNLLFLA